MKIEFKLEICGGHILFLFPGNLLRMVVGGGEFTNPDGKYYPSRLYKINDCNLRNN